MKIRPGRTRSVITGIAALTVMIVGLVMMSNFGGTFTPFVILWVIIGLAGVGAAFDNAFSPEGLPLYEVDLHRDKHIQGRSPAPEKFCPNCGQHITENDQLEPGWLLHCCWFFRG